MSPGRMVRLVPTLLFIAWPFSVHAEAPQGPPTATAAEPESPSRSLAASDTATATEALSDSPTNADTKTGGSTEVPPDSPMNADTKTGASTEATEPTGGSPTGSTSPTQVDRAREIGLQGLAAFGRGKFAEALELFAQAEELAHSPVFQVYMARCLLELSRPVEARALFARIVRGTAQPSADKLDDVPSLDPSCAP